MGGEIMKTIKLNDSTWIFDEGDVRFFLLTGTKEALLIDCGCQVRNAKELAGELTNLPIKLIYTHADPDHTGSSKEFSEFYMNPAEAGNYYKEHKKTGTMIPVEDKDIIDLGERPLEIISLPGHTPGSIGILDVKNRWFFSGDPIQDGKIFMFGERREFHAYALSLEKAIKLQDRFEKIFPSHGTYPIEKNIMPKLLKGAREYLDGKLSGQGIELFGKKAVDIDLGYAHFLCDK